jgi:hypothetical protein
MESAPVEAEALEVPRNLRVADRDWEMCRMEEIFIRVLRGASLCEHLLLPGIFDGTKC